MKGKLTIKYSYKDCLKTHESAPWICEGVAFTCKKNYLPFHAHPILGHHKCLLILIVHIWSKYICEETCYDSYLV